MAMGRPQKWGEPTMQVSMRLPVSVVKKLDAMGDSRADVIVGLMATHAATKPPTDCEHETVKVLDYMTICADCGERVA